MANYNFCRDCIHQIKPPSGCENDPDSLCDWSIKLNYVTGEREMRPCKMINYDGDCDGFQKR